MSELEWVSMDEVLNMIDHKYGFAEDPIIVNLLEACKVPRPDRHLIDRRAMLRYINYYRNKLGTIECNTHQRKGFKYSRRDIEKVINHPEMTCRFEDQLKKRAIRFGIDGIIVPKCIYNEFLKTIPGEDLQAIKISGYTENQLKLFNLDNHELENTRQELVRKIEDLYNEIIKLKAELSDVESEQKKRKFSRKINS